MNKDLPVLLSNDFITKLQNLPEQQALLIEAQYQASKTPEWLQQRQQFWSDNYGVPSLDFQLLFHQALSANTPQQILHIMNKGSVGEKIQQPEAESSGRFVKTLNGQGYMTTGSVDPFTQHFIDCAVDSERVLEIGAAFGQASLQVLSQGGTVFCNDMDPRHLAVVVAKQKKLTRGKLIPVAGVFPHELKFSEHYFDVILIARVLHFFPGEQLVAALKIAKTWLKPQGKLIVINETPYLKNWQSFLGEYQQRKQRGDKWPGVIANPKHYEQSRSVSLPPLVHWLDADTLQQAFLQAGFAKADLNIAYIDRQDQFPSDMLLAEGPGESIGGIAVNVC